MSRAKEERIVRGVGDLPLTERGRQWEGEGVSAAAGGEKREWRTMVADVPVHEWARVYIVFCAGEVGESRRNRREEGE